MFREPTLTLCVFKNQQVDFVRTKDIGKELGKAGKTVPWLIEELAQVVQFYEVEVLGSPGKWEITLLVDSHDSVQDAGEGLKARLPDAKLSIFNADAAYHDISVKQSQGAADTPSPVAVGLAMRLAVKETAVPQVNLMPSNIVKLRTIRRDALVAANAVAATLLMAILAVDVPALKTERVWRNVAEHRASISALNLSELREQQRVLDRQLKLQTDTISHITAIPRVQRDIDWADMLKEIKKAVPRTVCITNIESKDNTRMSVEGLALNNDAVRALVIALKRSKHVSSAALLESEKADLETGIVRYQVNCSLIDTKGESADAE
jgi:Tfp pilus assembly protein PilN